MTWQNKSTTTFTNQSKSNVTFNPLVGYLLQEVGDYILWEDGSKIVLDATSQYKRDIAWTNLTKS